MLTYLALKFLHIIGAAVLLGTGAGIAFFMLLAHRTGDAATVASVARIVVIADFLFTATAVVVQPITGALLAWIVGYSLLDGWILLSIALYLLTGAFWLPVVWMQMRMRDLAAEAVREAKPLPARIPPPVSPLVRLRLSGIRRSGGHLLADDRQAAARLSRLAPPRNRRHRGYARKLNDGNCREVPRALVQKIGETRRPGSQKARPTARYQPVFHRQCRACRRNGR